MQDAYAVEEIEIYDQAIPTASAPSSISWGVYIPTKNPGNRAGESEVEAENDDAGILDPTLDCTWYSQSTTVNTGAWFTHLVFKDGGHITDNDSEHIWDSDRNEAVLRLIIVHKDPREYILQFRETIPPEPPETDPTYVVRDLKDTDGYVVIRMVYINPGHNLMRPSPFTIGSAQYEEFRHFNEEQHAFSLPSAYWICADEVSYMAWETLSGNSAGIAQHLNDDQLSMYEDNYIGMNQPITYVKYQDASNFCTGALSTKISASVRLPNEAEWEYACRANKNTAYGNKKGYTLDGYKSDSFDNGNQDPVNAGNQKDYYKKVSITVNDHLMEELRTTNPPEVLSMANQFINGAWESKAFHVRYTVDCKLKVVQDILFKTYVDANYNSYLKKWYGRMYAFEADHTQAGVTGYFSVDPENGNMPLTTTRGWNAQHIAGMYATTDEMLSKAVTGLYVPVEYNIGTDVLNPDPNPWSYTDNPNKINDFRKVIDGIMPLVDNQTPLLPYPASGYVQYYQLHEYDHSGQFLGAPILSLSGGSGGLPIGELVKTNLDWETPWPGWYPEEVYKGYAASLEISKPIEFDAYDCFNKNYVYHQANIDAFSHMNRDQVRVDYSYSIDLNNRVSFETKYEHRNDWGLGHMHGNVSEWCMPGGYGINVNKRWDGYSGYQYDIASPLTGYKIVNPSSPVPNEPAYVVARGGSWRASMEDCRSAFRLAVKPGLERPTIGFRFIITP
ncbi:MAG: SUMF1/EgtB/PvdO family nonheme iron enzyme [Planctomycetes bacterium]|nr:SUMF1/EgtB/PvdO family nonheme iron enzyme [Planctomycetota bacterium]